MLKILLHEKVIMDKQIKNRNILNIIAKINSIQGSAGGEVHMK